MAIRIEVEWYTPIDLDLGIAIQHRDKIGPKELIFHGNIGDSTKPPFLRYEGDRSGSTRKKHRKESVLLANVEGARAIELFLWDHEAAQTGVASSYLANDLLRISATDNENHRVEFLIEDDCSGNCVFAAHGDIQRKHGLIWLSEGRIKTLPGTDEVSHSMMRILRQEFDDAT